MTQTPSTTANEQAYQAATEAVVLYDATTHGRVRLEDRDRADLLHRLSTNDIAKLTPGMGTRTALVNHNARIIDLLTVYNLPEHVLALTSPGQGAAIAQVLQKNIFFNDRVKVQNLTATTVQIEFYGPQAAATLAQITSVDPGEWAVHHIQAVEVNGRHGWLARTLPLAGDGFVLVCERDDWTAMEPAFAEIVRLDQATYNVLRVEAGYPGWGHELSLDYIPLEAQLRDAISFTKGCYVGQEIIARMDSRQRLAKQLMGLRLSGAAPLGTQLQADGKAQGELTSVVESPRFGTIGLGYVRTGHAKPGTKLTAGEGVTAEVVEAGEF